jgi:nucleoside-diphosphate-sugar epimerase
VDVFVSGGSRFVGRNLIAALVARGDRVSELARSDAAAAAIETLGARVVRGDLDDIAVLRRGMAQCQAAFHSAVLVDPWGDPVVFYDVNVRGTANMLEAARAAGVLRFVHVGTEARSSAAVQSAMSTRHVHARLSLWDSTRHLRHKRRRWSLRRTTQAWKRW